jgi:hypothetical protein
MRIVVVALLALAVGALAATARADGDPASDVLYFQDAYLPYPAPSKHASSVVLGSIRSARSDHYTIKVAVIATRTDLGSVPSLFGKPKAYAQFLGEEIRSFYTGTLVVAMPAGFGVWKGSGDTTREQHTLAAVKVHAGTVDELVLSAAAGVRKLAGVADTPSTRDRISPHVKALPASAQAGKTAKLRYRVGDNSGRSREVVRVYGANYFLYASIVSPMERARGSRLDSVRWHAPAHLDESKLRFCVLARDPAGNASTTSCAPLRVKQ